MKLVLATAIALSLSVSAQAALDIGARAPLFTAKASLGGNEFEFSLQEALKKGPVVLYFYPAAFTKGCTVEAHDFAEAIEQYRELGASVIGVSRDDIDVLKKFSVSECRSKFAVAADTDQHIMRDYDAILPIRPEYANRTSYVITPDGRVFYSYTDLAPDKHVANTLDAVKRWKATVRQP